MAAIQQRTAKIKPRPNVHVDHALSDACDRIVAASVR
jgi:hypothetical protein